MKDTKQETLTFVAYIMQPVMKNLIRLFVMAMVFDFFVVGGWFLFVWFFSHIRIIWI